MPDRGGIGLPVQHLRRLQAVTSALLAPRTVGQVAAAASVAILSSFATEGVALLVEDEDGRIRVAGAAGSTSGRWEVEPFVAGGVPGAVAVVVAGPLAVEDRALLGLMTAQVAVAVARTMITGRDRRESTLLQQGLASSLPGLPDGIRAAARYAAGGSSLVGGDWFDVIELRGRRIAAVIGDVGGRGVEAAPEMDRIRAAVEAYLVAGLGPGRALESANVLRLMPGGGDRFATVACVLVDLDAHSLRVARAGHPAPVLRDARGTRLLAPPPGPPLGVDPSASYVEFRLDLVGDALLVLLTDGLLERRDMGLDDRAERLRQVVGFAPSDEEEAADEILDALGGTDLDDGALLVVSLSDLS